MTRFFLIAALVTAFGPVTVRAADPSYAKFDPKLAHKIQGHTSDVLCIAFSPDGALLATAGKDKTVRLWDAKTGERKQRIPNQEEAYCVTFSPDGKQVVVGSFGGAINVFDVATGDKVRGLKADNSIALMRWSPDAGQFAVVLIDGEEVALLDATTGKLLGTCKGHTKAVNELAYSPDGKLLATVSDDSTIRLWNTATGAEKDSLKAHDGPIHGLTFSADGKVLVTGSDDTVVRWDVATGNIIKPVLELPAVKNGGSRRIAALPSGRVWVQGWGGSNTVFDPTTGKVLFHKAGFEGDIIYYGKSYGNNRVAVSADGKTYAIAFANDIYVWDASKEFGAGKPTSAERKD